MWWGVGDGSDLHGDAGELSPPSVGVLMILESGMGRGTGRATGGGGGSRKEPGILLWPPPLGCRWTIQKGEQETPPKHPEHTQPDVHATHSKLLPPRRKSSDAQGKDDSSSTDFNIGQRLTV